MQPLPIYTTDNAYLPEYAKNPPAGLSPKGIIVPSTSRKLAKTLMKVAFPKTQVRTRRSLLRRIGLRKTWRARFF